MRAGLVCGVGMVALLLGACGTDDGDDSVVELGFIQILDDEPAIVEAPVTVAVGVSFLVTAYSFGGGCTSFERTDVELTSEGADVRLFDRTDIPGEGAACPNNLAGIPHEVTLVFRTTGTKTLRIHGRNLSSPSNEVIEVPLTLVVE